MTSKLSVSLPDDDVDFIDDVAARHGGNRSAAIHDLVRLAREMSAVDSYSGAFEEWEHSGEAAIWDAAASDGITE